MSTGASTVSGVYWAGSVITSGRNGTLYRVLWLFPSGAFKWIECWPGYEWQTAIGEWQQHGQTVELRGHWTSQFSDAIDFTEGESLDFIANFITLSLETLGALRLNSKPPSGDRFKEPLKALDTASLLLCDQSTIPTNWREFSRWIYQVSLDAD
jgi:hypothetical protein